MVIYCIQNKINDKCYIGQSSISIESRQYSHLLSLRNDNHYNDYLQRSWNKHGEDAFQFKVVEEGFETINELNKAEEFWITLLQTTSPEGYNLKFGGNNCKHLKSTKDKISESNTKYTDIGVYDFSGNFLSKHKTVKEASLKYDIDEQYIRINLLGTRNSTNGYIFKEINYNNPKKEIDEYRYRNKKYIGQYSFDGNLLNVYSKINDIPKEFNPKSVRSACCGGSKSYNKYMWEWNEVKENLPKKIKPYVINHHQKKKVIKYDLKGNFINVYDSLIEGANSVGFDYPHNIGLCCKDIKRSAGGYMWKFYTDNFPKKIKPYKIKHSKHNTRKVAQYTIDGEFIKEHKSLEEARKCVGLKRSSPIGEVCRGNYKTSMGFKWEYIN